MIYKNVILDKIQSKQFVRQPENSLKSVGNKLPTLRLLPEKHLILTVNHFIARTIVKKRLQNFHSGNLV